jgi:hypothetical protein
MAELEGLAERLPDSQSRGLERPPRRTLKTVPRRARRRHRKHVVAERVRHLEADRRGGRRVRVPPGPLKKACRGVVLRKRLVVGWGRLPLFEPDRFRFPIANDRTTPASDTQTR